MRCAPLTRRILENPALGATVGERCLLLVLSMFADDAGGNCFPAIKTLARCCGVNERNVRRMLARLSAPPAGLVVIEERARQHRTARYRLVIPEISTGAAPALDCDRPGAVPGLGDAVEVPDRTLGAPDRTLGASRVGAAPSDLSVKEQSERPPAAPLFLSSNEEQRRKRSATRPDATSHAPFDFGDAAQRLAETKRVLGQMRAAVGARSA